MRCLDSVLDPGCLRRHGLTQTGHTRNRAGAAWWPRDRPKARFILRPNAGAVNNPLDEMSFALAGWRDRLTGTMHLGPCPDFEELEAALIEDALWRPERQYERLCPACFPFEGRVAPAVRRRIEPYGY
jgi:hypothetical protein